jgi:hypothetical protein
MHDRAGHAGAHRVVQEHAVQHRARRRVQAEADVGKAQDDLDVRKFVADQLDAFQRPLAELAVILVAGGDGEGQRVDQQVAIAAGRALCRRNPPGAGDASLSSGVLAMPTSSMVSAITAAPNFLARISRSVAWRPSRHPRN